ncbi:MAG TPA: hypothetical protein VI488_13055 [Candidatus Angelobacter sp.]
MRRELIHFTSHPRALLWLMFPVTGALIVVVAAAAALQKPVRQIE